jgi:hypothetical protein
MHRDTTYHRAMRILLITMCCTFVACYGPDFEGTVRARAAHDFHCSEDDLKVENISGGTFDVKGCGYHETYDCVGSSTSYNGTTMGGTATCTKEKE